MATVSHYEMHLGPNSYYVASNPQLSPMYDKTKKSWSQRLKITKTEKIASPITVPAKHQHLNEFATFEYGPNGALSRSMQYADPWLYSTVRGIPAARPTVHYHHNGHHAAFLAPLPAEVAVVVCSCPEYLTGTKRDVKKASICKKCKGSRLPLAPIGGTVRLRPTSAPIMHQQRISAATLRLPSSTKSRPSILDTQNDPYDMMRRTRLLSPDPPRENLKISSSTRMVEKSSSSSSSSKNQNGTMGKNSTASRGRTRYRSSTGTTSTIATISTSAAINATTNEMNEQEITATISKTATIRSRSASRGKTPQSQKPLRDRWSDAGGNLQIDPGGRRSILECSVNPYELISCGIMNASNEFSPPDSDGMFDLPMMRSKSNSSDAVAIAAAAAAALIQEQKNNVTNKGKKLGYTNVQAIAGQRIILGEEKMQSKLLAQNGDNFLYEDIELQAQMSTNGSNVKLLDTTSDVEVVRQSIISFAADNDDDMSTLEFMADGQTKYHPKRPPRRKQETNASAEEEGEVHNQNGKTNTAQSPTTLTSKQSNFDKIVVEVSSPTTTTSPKPKPAIKSILKRPSSTSSSSGLSPTTSISESDSKKTNQNASATSATSPSTFKSYINQSSQQTAADSNPSASNATPAGSKKVLTTSGSAAKKFHTQPTSNSSSSAKDNSNFEFDSKYNSLDRGNSNNSSNSNTFVKRNSNSSSNSGGGGGGSQFYLPMPSQSQPNRKKVQFMVEDKIIQDDPETDDSKPQQNSQMAEDKKQNHTTDSRGEYSFDNGSSSSNNGYCQINEDFSNDNNNRNYHNNNDVVADDGDVDFDRRIVLSQKSNNDINSITNGNRTPHSIDQSSTNNNHHRNDDEDGDNDVHYHYRNDDDVDEKSCQHLMLMLEQQKMQSEILNLLQKQTNDLLKNSKNFATELNGEDDGREVILGQAKQNVSTNYVKGNKLAALNGENSMHFAFGEIESEHNIYNSNEDAKEHFSSPNNTTTTAKSSNSVALRRTHSDRLINMTSNMADLSEKIQLTQFNDTMALRLKSNRAATTPELFTQRQQPTNGSQMHSNDDRAVQPTNQQRDLIYRPKEPPPPPPPSNQVATANSTTTTAFNNVAAKSSPQKFNTTFSTSSSTAAEKSYGNKKNEANNKDNKNTNGDESSLMVHSNDGSQTINFTKNSTKSASMESSSSSASTVTTKSVIETTKPNKNSLQKNNNMNNGCNSSIIDHNINRTTGGNSKKIPDKIKTATKGPELNRIASQSAIIAQSQSKGSQQQHQQQMKSSLSTAQQKRHSIAEQQQQNVQQEQKLKTATKHAASKENIKVNKSNTKTKRVSWAGSAEKMNILEYSKDVVATTSTTKRTTNGITDDNSSTKAQSNINRNGNVAPSNMVTKELIKIPPQHEQQLQQDANRPTRPTSLPLTVKQQQSDEQKLLLAQNEISRAARLFSNSNKLLLTASSPLSGPQSSTTTSQMLPIQLPSQQQQHQRTVVRVAPFNTSPATTNLKNSAEIHRLQIKHTDDNTISNAFIDDAMMLNNGNGNTHNDVAAMNRNQKKTSILINGDDCYSTVNASSDTPIYQSSVVVTDGNRQSPTASPSDFSSQSNSSPNSPDAEEKSNISKCYPSNTVTINVNSSSRIMDTTNITAFKNHKNSKSAGHVAPLSPNSNGHNALNASKTIDDELISIQSNNSNKTNFVHSIKTSKSIIPINGSSTELNGGPMNDKCDNDCSSYNQQQPPQLKVVPRRGKTTLITLDFEAKTNSCQTEDLNGSGDDPNNASPSYANISHEEELVKILRNPVEAVKRNLVPHVCGKMSDVIGGPLHIFPDDNSSTVSTSSRTSSTSTLATVLDDPLMLRSLNPAADLDDDGATSDGAETEAESHRTASNTNAAMKLEKNSLVGRLLEDPTLSHLADGLENDVIVRLIESSLKRLKENRNSIDTSGTKDNDDMTKLIDISLQKIKAERHKLETSKSTLEEQQESQSNRGSISSGNSYTSANYELFEFETNNESDCYQSCSSEITNCDEETNSTQSKFYQMLVDATLSEIEITANNDDEHHYESIRVNSDPIYEEIGEIPPPLPLSPPPVNEAADFERKAAKSMFEGASKYDILSYLVDAKERGIVKEDSFDYSFTNGINDIILEEDKASENGGSSSAAANNKELRNQRNTSQHNSNAVNGGNTVNSSNNSIGTNINNNGSSKSSSNINSDSINSKSNNSPTDTCSRNSHISIASESSNEDTQSLSSSINEKLLTPGNSATNTLSSNSSQRSKPTSIDIERNDSGVGSETSKSSRSKYQNPPAACLLDKHSPLIHLCEDCDGPVETQITDSGVMYAPLVCRKCGKKRAERKEIITEIVETEEKYGRDLQIILEEFCQPMLVAGLLTQEQLSAIFLNTEELLENNQTLAERMRDALDIALEQGDDDLLTVNIGKIFLESTQMLHAFESYCVRQAAASLLLANLEKEKELLRIFLRVSQMENTVLRRMNLNSFLMVPVQRVTKYPLLLARLYKVTPTHLDGRELLKQAQEKIELHLNHMNQEAKDVPTKLWRRISSSSPNRRASCEIDMINIKLRKMAIDVLEWNHDEVRFTMEGKLLFTQPTDSNWKKGRTIKLTPVNALLVTNGKPSTNYKSDKAYAEQLHFPKHTGIREASLLLVKEKCGRYTLIREPLYMDRCIICTEADWDDYFEVHEISSKDTFIFKAEDGVRTKHWYKQLQYHSQGMGAWRKRRNALANIMINGMLSRT